MDRKGDTTALLSFPMAGGLGRVVRNISLAHMRKIDMEEE